MAGASVAIFVLLRLIPGDAADQIAGGDATPEAVAAIRAHLGLDQPWAVQYVKWLSGFVSGDLGRSYILRAPIGELIARGAGHTIELTVAAMLLAIFLGLGVGILGATRDGRVTQTFVAAYTTVGFSIPTFVTSVVLVLVFAVVLGVLPAGGNPVALSDDPQVALQYLIMPAFALALPLSSTMSRFLMTALRQVLQEDYIRTAVAKGMPMPWIIFRHALPNALPPVLTIIGLQFGSLLGGAVIVETVFSWPGVGRLLLDGVSKHDYLVVQDLSLLAVLVFVAVQLLTDLAYAAIDPRVRLS